MRVAELCSDAACQIGSAEEYKNSVLLSTADADPATFSAAETPPPSSAIAAAASSSSAASSAVDGCVDLTGSDSDSEGPLSSAPIAASTRQQQVPAVRPVVGSRVIQAVVRLLDEQAALASGALPASAATSNSTVNTTNCSRIPHSLSPSTLVELRGAVSRLLLLERDATKYHRDASVPFLRGLARHADGRLNVFHRAQSTSSNGCSSSSSSSSSRGSVAAEPLVVVRAEQVAFLAQDVLLYLASQSARLQRALYKLPTDGHMVPALFRRAFLDPTLAAGRASLEDDGFELLRAGDDPTAHANSAGGPSPKGGSSMSLDQDQLLVTASRSVYSEPSSEEDEEEGSGEGSDGESLC